MTTPWQPTGNVHRLDEAIIANQVLAESGVYGLHNGHQQLFIGEAADLRAALLLHCHESRKFFRGRQPTHFAFEICDAETRAQRAQALIAAHRPAVRSPQPSSFANLSMTKQKISAGGEPITTPEWPEATQSNPGEARPKYLSRGQLATLLLLSMVTAGFAGYLGVLAGQQIAERRIAVLQWAEYQRKTQERQVAAAAENPLANGEPARADGATVTDPSTPPAQVVQASNVSATAAAAAAEAGASQTAATENKPTARSESKLADAPWSVQIAATQDQSAAEKLQSKLKEKGFDAYIVEAELASGRWYRLRVGRFNARQEADATQQALLAKANIRDAFVTGK